MKVLHYSALLAIGMMFLGCWVVACSSDDDDDDNDSGDGCTVETLCDWAINLCGVYPDMDSCTATTEDCSDVEGALNCLCGCQAADPTCESNATEDCATNCQSTYCL